MQQAALFVTSSPTSSSLVSTPKQIPFHFTPIKAKNFLFGCNSFTKTRTFLDYKNQYQRIMASSASPVVAAPKWAQKTVTLPALRRGCHLITPQILKEIGQDLSGFKCGLAHFFLQHTSASLTVNENYDSDVRYDTETFLNKVVPEGSSAPWRHTLEGPDDMPAHIKSSMFGCSLTIPISDGRLNMGTWQGIWLCEHRDAATPRKIVITLNGI